jgi:hypothetical protein
MKNLKQITFSERFKIANDMAQMLNDAQGQAYSLSMPLIIAATLGSSHYPTVRNMMMISLEQPDINRIDQKSFKAWMLGRVLMSDLTIKESDDKESQAAVQELKELLNSNLAADSFTAWAWAYLACVDYEYAKGKMIQATEGLAQSKASVSDQLWAWVMCMQAAAREQDGAIYTRCIQEIQKIGGKPQLAQALITGLTRNEQNHNNDFPAWALALVRSAAEMMGDMNRVNDLQDPIRQSLQEAIELSKKHSDKNPTFAKKVLAEQRLAEVINQVTNENNKEMRAKNRLK